MPYSRSTIFVDSSLADTGGLPSGSKSYARRKAGVVAFWDSLSEMYICYIDESGTSGTLTSASCNIEPAIVHVGLFVHQAKIAELTNTLLRIKRRFTPAKAQAGTHALDAIKIELKGSDLRSDAANPSHRKRRRAFGIMDACLKAIESTGSRFVARILVKEIGGIQSDQTHYTTTVQDICTHFQHLLTHTNQSGIVILDSRNKGKNTPVAHSIFTQKYKTTGDTYPGLIEAPTFGHSDNHAGLQLADTLASALLFPIAMASFCLGHVTSVHVKPGYSDLKPRFASRLKALTYRYEVQQDDGQLYWRGGVWIRNKLNDIKPREFWSQATPVLASTHPPTSP